MVGGRKEDVEWEGRKGQQRPAQPASREEERKTKQEREGEEGQGAGDKGRTLDQELSETPIRRGSMASFAHWEVHTKIAQEQPACSACRHEGPGSVQHQTRLEARWQGQQGPMSTQVCATWGEGAEKAAGGEELPAVTTRGNNVGCGIAPRHWQVEDKIGRDTTQLWRRLHHRRQQGPSGGHSPTRKALIESNEPWGGRRECAVQTRLCRELRHREGLLGRHDLLHRAEPSCHSDDQRQPSGACGGHLRPKSAVGAGVLRSSMARRWARQV